MLKAVECIARDQSLGLVGLACLVCGLAGALLFWYRIGPRAAEARRSRALANAAIEGLIFEQDGLIRDVNPALCAMAAMPADEMLGRHLASLIRGLTLTALDQPGEYDLLRADGAFRPVEVLWRDGATTGSHVVAVRDLSVATTTHHQIQRLVQFDPLTGLGNREMFEHQLRKAMALSDRATVGVAVLYVELDRFESVRDAYGPLAADQIIIQAARRLRACVRDTDTIARLGPDAFAVLQPLADKPSDAAALAERIVADMAVPFDPGGQPVTLSVSVGVALYPGDGATVTDMIKSAALGLCRAKQDGRGTWRYVQPTMNVALLARQSLEQDLCTALRDGQFTLAYQPFLNAATMETAGFEALLRWEHPTRGVISPAEFIPLAEACGLIVPIGRWVLATACAQAATWPLPMTLAVNLSPAQFVQPGIVSTVADVLRDTGLPSTRLELEITEGTLMDDTQNALRTLTDLKLLGVRIAMDDFGTGYSSLSYLRKFPFDKIKIDRSFISDAEDDDMEAETIVQAIIAMGRSLRLEVTAEGVETEAQLAMLKALGCGYVQGYLLGRPGAVGCPDELAEKAHRPSGGVMPTQAVRLHEVVGASGQSA
jgi:diguanylate cyclase